MSNLPDPTGYPFPQPPGPIQCAKPVTLNHSVAPAIVIGGVEYWDAAGVAAIFDQAWDSGHTDHHDQPAGPTVAVTAPPCGPRPTLR